MELYGVVTMDLVGSRSLENRSKIQEQLDKIIEQINQNHNEFLVSPINFTVGDEWQLITSHPDKVYDFIHLFQQELWQIGVKFYAGVGIGRISTNLNSDTRRMDGPCFIAAREAIDISKNKPRYGRGRTYIYSKSNKIFFKHFTEKSSNNINKNTYDDFVVYNLLDKTQGFELHKHSTEAAVTSEADYKKNQHNCFLLSNDNELKLYALESIINLTIENNEILKDKMTAKQKEIYKQYFNAGSYRKIADENIRSISSISQSLNTAEYYTIQRNHAMVRLLIKDYCELLRRKNGL
ncbi:MAG: SatD family protein [Lutisporaceae bacterium]